MKRLIYPILILLIATMACTIGSFGQPAPTSTVEPSSTPLFEVPTAIPIIKALPTDTAIPAQPTTGGGGGGALGPNRDSSNTGRFKHRQWFFQRRF
jgi:hypothetical protein